MFFPVFGTLYKKLVRRQDPMTSHEAAKAVDTTKLEKEVLKAIATFPEGCISDDILEMFPAYPYSSITARYKALYEKGLIDIIGVRKARSGRNQRVMLAK